MHCISRRNEFFPRRENCQQPQKKSGENDGSSWCPFFCVSNYVGSQNVSSEKVWGGYLTFIAILALVCPRTRIYYRILIHSSLRIFWHLQNFHMAGTPWSNMEFEFASWWGKLKSSFHFGLLPINIVSNTYTAIHRDRGANCFHPPTTPGGLALEPEL